mmetsp:Transcript_33497/g.98725  ORF Transcript_33497/g.98725 Transcript_33497/m.98725 type:complete len:526 (-) Transcript_33497:526-2103(-)
MIPPNLLLVALVTLLSICAASPSWRFSPPSTSDYKITLLINPCGANGTHGGGDPLGYDCCMNKYGAGEYARIDNDAQIYSPRGQPFVEGLQINSFAQLALPNEVFHNINLVDDDFNPIPLDKTRRAADETTIDPSCLSMRTPHPHCIDYRVRAVRSKLRPACSDNNQTVDATLDCYTPDGKLSSNCMQVGFSQTSLIHQCGGVFANESRCGTFLEIHRSSPYNDDNTVLAETRIIDRVADGTITTIIPLTYKADPNRILCNFQESRVRIGSLVRINSNSAVCCCPPIYRDSTKKGSFFCPRLGSRDGPMATKPKSLEEQLVVDDQEAVYPLCQNYAEDQDVLMCSKPVSTPFATHGAYTYPCEEARLGEDDDYGSADLEGLYEDVCPIDSVFVSCAMALGGTSECLQNDRRMSFQDEIGKVVDIIHDDDDSEKDIYQVSFNDGRTHYSFARHELDLINLDNTYELWFIQRNRFENVIKKTKEFRVIWPPCSFDSVNNQFFPYAQLDENGKPMAVVFDNKYDDVME